MIIKGVRISLYIRIFEFFENFEFQSFRTFEFRKFIVEFKYFKTLHIWKF